MVIAALLSNIFSNSVNSAIYDLIFGLNGYLIFFIIVILIWLLTEIIGGIIIPNRRRGGGKVEQRKKGLNIVVVLGWDAIIISSILLSVFRVAVLPDWAYFLGIALMLIGVAVRQWAIAVLGQYFTHVMGVQKDQTVVQTGPYCLIRHPSYTGILLIQVGFALVFQSWIAAIVAAISFGLVYGYRMLTEEKFLVKELGDKYMEYMKRTKRIIPFLI